MKTPRNMTLTQTDVALDTYMKWSRSGVPGMVTAHEVYMLTGGILGAEGDMTAVNGMSLVQAAKRFAQATV